MQLVPLFNPVRGLCWNMWKVLSATCGEDVATHAVRLVVSGYWCDLVTEALSNRWELVQREDRRCLVVQSSRVERDLYRGLEGEEDGWLAVQYRGEPLYVSSLFYDTRGQVLRVIRDKTVKSVKQAARSDSAMALYIAAFVIILFYSVAFIPCDTQSSFLRIYRTVIQTHFSATNWFLRFITLGSIPISDYIPCGL